MLVVTRDRGLTDRVLSAAAAAGVSAEVVEGGPIRLGGVDVVVVGVDVAAELAAAPVHGSEATLLVGEDATELARWSVTLGARVVVVPEGGRYLTAALSGRAAEGRGTVVGFVGGSGGVGTSTLVAGIGAALARRGTTVAVVDVDPLGPGIDVHFGAESAPGWRWEQLRGARGQIGELADRLVRVDGVDIVAMSRRQSDGQRAGAEAVQAVVSALTRTHAAVLLDLGRGAGELESAGSALAVHTVLVAGLGVGPVASAWETTARMDVDSVVMRVGRGRGMGAEDVAAKLRLSLLGTVPHDKRIAADMEAGRPPERCGTRAWHRACEAVAVATVAR